MSSKEKAKKSLLERVLSVISWVLIALLCFIVIYMLAIKISGKIPNFFGYSCMNVVSGSMEPTIKTGSIIIVKQTDTDSLKKGDIISFYSDDEQIKGMPNTHRIEEISVQNSQKVFITKGDANPLKDSVAVTKDKVIGIYVGSVSFLSGLGGLLGNAYFYLICIIVPAGVLFIMELINLAKTAKSINDEQTENDESGGDDNEQS